MTTTGDQLLRTILDRPGDDAPRKVYSDWLEENGQPERAEFIRTELEILKTPQWEPFECDVCSATADPDDGEVRHGKGCYVLSEDGGGSEWVDENLEYAKLTSKRNLLLKEHIGTWTADIPEDIMTKLCPRCVDTPADWETNAVECRHCDGTGVVFNDDAVEFTRGFVSGIRCTRKQFLEHAKAIFSRHPIERVTLDGVKPAVSWVEKKPTSYYWAIRHNEVPIGFASELGPILFSLLPSDHAITKSANRLGFATSQAANEALNTACIRFGRSEAGLPELENA